MSNTKKFNTIYIHYAVVIFFMFLFRFIPPFGGLTEISMQVIGVFIGTIYGFITLSIVYIPLLGLVALGLTDYISTTNLFAAAFGSQMFVMIIGLLILTAFVQKADLTEVIVDFLLTRKYAVGRPFVIMGSVIIAAYVASLLSQPLAVFLIFMEFVREIMKKTGLQPHSKGVTAFAVGLAFSLVLGEIGLPFKGCAIVGIGAYEAVTGATLNLMSFTIFMFPMCVFLIIAYVLFCKYILRVDLSALATYEHQNHGKQISLKQKVSLIGVITAMALLLLPSILPASWGITAIVKELGNGGLCLLVVAILMMIRMDGEPLLDIGKIAGSFPWGVFCCVAIIVPLANALSSDAVGLKTVLTGAASALLADKPIILVVVLVVLFTALITNLANNYIVCSIFITIICLMADVLPCNPIILCVLIMIASNLSMFFPAANPMCAILFGMNDLIEFKSMVVQGFISCMFLCLVTILIGFPFASLIF